MAEPQRVQEVLYFPSNITIDRDFKATDLVPAPRIHFENTKISAIGSWWSTEITENLIDLALFDCKISLVNLLAMLQRTPNLCLLSLGPMPTLVYNAAVDKYSELRLQKMETLTLFELKQSKVMEVFIRTFPRLKEFELYSEEDECCDRFFDALDASDGRHTLEGLTVNFPTPGHVSRLARVKHQLQRLSFTILEEGETTKCLTEAFGNLLHLKRLEITEVPDVTDLPGLERLTELVSFKFMGYEEHQPFSFSGIKHLNLEELSLINVTLAPGELQEYIGSASKLRKIVLQNCVLDSWAEVFDCNPEEFRHLELHCDKVYTDASLLTYLEGMRYL